ncbi:hypothetical protein [Reyranella sp.]|uniref:hypothetical protein n=1 Tax=Reyranella sp. TaxID=1929291 RepID=UPI00378378F2
MDEAKARLMELYFPSGVTEVYYGRQLEVWLEKEFFHWITRKALVELREERQIGFSVEETAQHEAHFYWPRRHRYPRRQIKEIIQLIDEFSEPTFTRAVGHHAELLFDSSLAYTGFRVRSRNVRSWGGKWWSDSNHDLDRVIERDGVAYGVEIKNQLGYIDQTEFGVKLQMCEHLELRPLFVARMMPANYINAVYQAGGFSLIVGDLLYPLMADRLAKQVRDRLKYPVVSVRALPDTALARFTEWHKRQGGV